jgi:hypothetical protein
VDSSQKDLPSSKSRPSFCKTSASFKSEWKNSLCVNLWRE